MAATETASLTERAPASSRFELTPARAVAGATQTPLAPTVSAASADTKVFSTQNAEGIAANIAKIGSVAQTMGQRMSRAVRQIEDINLQTRLLSFNAQLEASRAGAAGRAFDVVAREMVALSARTATAASALDDETRADLIQLGTMIERTGGEVRGTRLSDLAFTNIDLIDRNLYERSCDVRWWATDSSCVDAALDPARNGAHASQRLGVILDAYTVYYDIVLCDRQGRVIANGRPGKFHCQGSIQSDTGWFRSAMATRSGGDFGFQGLHQSPTLANGQKILVYSAAVRRDGKANGEPIGCLGVIFNWEALAQTIVSRTQLGAQEKNVTRVCIIDRTGLVLADNRERHLLDRIGLDGFRTLIECRKGYALTSVDGTPHIVAYAHSPGFETYATGWHSFIFQQLTIG